MRTLTLALLPLLVACQQGDDDKDDVLDTAPADTDTDTDSDTDTDTDADADTDTDADSDTDADTDSDTDTDTDTDTDVDTETGSTTVDCDYPAGAVEPMAEGEVLTPYSWPLARHMDGLLSTTVDLVDAHCDTDPDIDWSPHDVLVFVSIPAW